MASAVAVVVVWSVRLGDCVPSAPAPTNAEISSVAAIRRAKAPNMKVLCFIGKIYSR